MTNEEKGKKGRSAYSRLYRLVWEISWVIMVRWIPRSMFTPWKRLVLRLFGANISNEAIVYSSSKIHDPRNLIMEGKSRIAPEVNLYNADKVIIQDGATVSQWAYIYSGSHNVNSPELNPIYKPVVIGENAWIATCATVGMGVHVGRGAIVGVNCVVSKDIPPYAIVTGNPAKIVGFRYKPEEIIEMEKKIFKEEDRLPENVVMKNYKRYFLDCLDNIQKFTNMRLK